MRDDDQARQLRLEALERENEDLTRRNDELRAEIERLEIQAARVRGLAEERARLADALAAAKREVDRGGPHPAPELRLAAPEPAYEPWDASPVPRRSNRLVGPLGAATVLAIVVAAVSAYAAHRTLAVARERESDLRFERSEREAWQQRARDAELDLALERGRFDHQDSDSGR